MIMTEDKLAMPTMLKFRPSVIPDYQRDDDAWSEKDQQSLIDSLLRGYSLPKFYLHSKGNKKGKALVDGQQRWTAIRAFVADKFPVAKDAPPLTIEGESYVIAGLLHSQLDEEVQDLLETTNVTMVTISKATDEDVRDYFLRLQKGAPLNAAEKRRALDGPMPALVRDIADHDFFNHVAYSGRRCAYEATAGQLMLLAVEQKPCKLSGGDITKLYNSPPENSAEIAEQVTNVLNLMDQIFNHESEPHKRLKKTTIPALFGALYRLQEMDGKTLCYQSLYTWFEQFHDRVDDGEHEAYREATGKSVDSESSVSVRVNTMLSSMLDKGVES